MYANASLPRRGGGWGAAPPCVAKLLKTLGTALNPSKEDAASEAHIEICVALVSPKCVVASLFCMEGRIILVGVTLCTWKEYTVAQLEHTSNPL